MMRRIFNLHNMFHVDRDPIHVRELCQVASHQAGTCRDMVLKFQLLLETN